MKRFNSIFNLLFLLLFAFLIAFQIQAQPTPADTAYVTSDIASLEYIEYSGVITFDGDSTSSRYSKPFSINRIAHGPAFLSLVSSNPKDANGIKVLVDFQVTPVVGGASGYVTINDTLSIKASETNYLTIGSTNQPAYNLSYWAVIKATGLSTINRDSTTIRWTLRGYRPVASTRRAQILN